MSTEQFKGLHKVKRKGAAGEFFQYYAWRGGPRIKAEFGTEEFAAEFRELTGVRAVTLAAKPAAPSLSGAMLPSLLASYRNAREFTKLKASTQEAYGWHLDAISAHFNTFPIAAIDQKGARNAFLSWRDKLAERSPRTADFRMTVLARALNWAVNRELIQNNPCVKPGKTYAVDRRGNVWTEKHEAALLAAASPQLALVFLLGLYTGQRQGDILDMRWDQYDGEFIRLTQGKTNEAVAVPVAARLKAVLDGLERNGPFICLNSRGKPWDNSGFRASWRKLKIKAGITDDLHFHDLRGTAVSRMFLEGVAEADIAAITGHSLSDVGSILDKRYFKRDEAMGRRAIDALDARDRRIATEREKKEREGLVTGVVTAGGAVTADLERAVTTL